MVLLRRTHRSALGTRPQVLGPHLAARGPRVRAHEHRVVSRQVCQESLCVDGALGVVFEEVALDDGVLDVGHERRHGRDAALRRQRRRQFVPQLGVVPGCPDPVGGAHEQGEAPAAARWHRREELRRRVSPRVRLATDGEVRRAAAVLLHGENSGGPVRKERHDRASSHLLHPATLLSVSNVTGMLATPPLPNLRCRENESDSLKWRAKGKTKLGELLVFIGACVVTLARSVQAIDSGRASCIFVFVFCFFSNCLDGSGMHASIMG